MLCKHLPAAGGYPVFASGWWDDALEVYAGPRDAESLENWAAARLADARARAPAPPRKRPVPPSPADERKRAEETRRTLGRLLTGGVPLPPISPIPGRRGEL